MLFSIFILKVCYLKGHLLEKGGVVEEGNTMGCSLKVEGVTEVNKGQREAAIFLDTCFGCWILGSSETTSSL